MFLSMPFLSFAADCEKWKSEIAQTAINLTNYVLLCEDLQNNKISKEQFQYKVGDIIQKARQVQRRVETVSSCTDDIKFEKRRIALNDVLNIALPTMAVGEYLAPLIFEKLNQPDKTSEVQAQAQRSTGTPY